MKIEAKHALALVLGGALPGFITAFIQYFYPSYVYAAVILIVIDIIFTIYLLAYGAEAIDDYIHSRRIRNRWKSPLKVAILRENTKVPYEKETKDFYVWTHTSPEEWTEILGKIAKEKGIEIDTCTYVDIDQNFDDCNAILNPYGGDYPEKDLGSLATLRKISQYVKEGGVFVNVADVPSYWAHNSIIGRKVDITQAVYMGVIDPSGNLQIVGFKPFELTPLMKELSVKTVQVNPPDPCDLSGILGTAIPPVIYSRAMAIEPSINNSNVRSSVATKKYNYPGSASLDFTPLAFVHYGSGDFLFSLFWLDTNHDQNTPDQIDAVRRAIITLLIQNLSEKQSKIKRV